MCKEKDASTKFQQVSEAYEVLSDKQKRKEYDAYRSGGRGAGGFRQGFDNRGGGQENWNFHSTRSAEDIFREFFGGQGFNAGGFASSNQGFDASQQIAVRITFEEAAKGVQKIVSVNAIDNCAFCGGSGCSLGKTKVRSDGSALLFRSPAPIAMAPGTGPRT